MPGKSSIGFSGYKNLTFSGEIPKITKNIENLKIRRGRRCCSTSYSSGNQVDGSPLVAIAKRARVEPRTQVHVTMKMMF